MNYELYSTIVERSIIVASIVLAIGIMLILEKKFISENKNKYLTRFFQKSELILSGNMISIYRIIGGPICGYLLATTLYYQDYSNHAILIPLIVGLAMGDFLDGVVARSCNAESKLGMILDPLGDKVMIISIFMGIVTYLWLSFGNYIFIILLAIMIVPEIIGTLLRSKMSNPAASIIGKCKTTIQFILMGSIYYAIINNDFIEYQNIFVFCMIFAIILAFSSALMKINWKNEKTV